MKIRLVLGTVLALVMIAAPLFAQAPPPAAPAAPPPPPKVQAPKTQPGSPATVGAQFSDFDLPFAFENKLTKFSDLLKANSKKKLTILTFTNTSCASCQDEVQVLATLKDKLKDELQVVIVVTDLNAQRIADALGKVKDHFQFWLSDPYFTVPKLYTFRYTPATVFIAPSGKVLDLQSGFEPTDEGRAALVTKVEGYLK